MAMEPPEYPQPTAPTQQLGGPEGATPFQSASVPPPGAPVPPGVPVPPGGPPGGPVPPGAPTAPDGPWAPGMPAPAKKRGKAGLVVLSVVAGLLLVTSGVMAFLWLSTSSELSDTRTRLNNEIDELNTTVETRDGEIEQLRGELEDIEGQLSDAETELEGTENMVDALEEEKEIIRECIILAEEVNQAIENGEDVSPQQALDLETACQEADRILGF